MALPGKPIPGRYIVRFRHDVDDPVRRAAELTRHVNATLHFTYRVALKGFAAQMSEQAAAALKRHPLVTAVEIDQLVSTADVQRPAPWGLDRIDQRTNSLDTAYNYASTGAGVNVYIVDTGIRTTHTYFGGRAFGAFTAVADSFGTSDCNGHGTHVAGIVGSSLYGVAKQARLHSIRVLDCTGTGPNSGVIAALDWIASNRVLPAVANLSLGSEYSAALNQAVENTMAAGVVITVAAGNQGFDACQRSPASAATALTVAASTGTDSRASFSNWGTCVDLFAPGASIYSTWHWGDLATYRLNGTSMAAPHAAGAAALYLAEHPTASPSVVNQAILSRATAGMLSEVGTGSPNLLLYTGNDDGQAPPPSTEPPPPPPTTDLAPTAAFSATCPKNRCTFDGTGSSDDRGIVTYTWDFGDGLRTSTTTTAKVTHFYALAGVFTVTLTVTDAAGQSATARQTVKVRRV